MVTGRHGNHQDGGRQAAAEVGRKERRSNNVTNCCQGNVVLCFSCYSLVSIYCVGFISVIALYMKKIDDDDT